MQELPGRSVVGDKTGKKPRAFADTEACVVQEQHEQVIAAAEGLSEVHGVEDTTEFGFRECKHTREFLSNLELDDPNPQPGSKGQGRGTPESSS